MKSTIVLTLKDCGSSCTVAITAGVVQQIVSGGIPAADVLKRANAVLIGTAAEVSSECERAFGGDYIATVIPTRRASVYEAGNGLPGFGQTVLADDELWQIVTPDSEIRISTNGPGSGNSIEVQMISTGDQCNLNDQQWDDAHDGRVLLH